MHASQIIVLLAASGIAASNARVVHDKPNSRMLRRVRRQVPQEHSHEFYLRATSAALALNNPDGIIDAVFGLLGNAAAA